MKRRLFTTQEDCVQALKEECELVHHSYHFFSFQVLGFLLLCCTHLCEGTKETGCFQSHTYFIVQNISFNDTLVCFPSLSQTHAH